jgi:hypothetical protein
MKLKKSQLKEIIRRKINEMSTTASVPGYNSKNFLDPNADPKSFDIDYSGLQGTGKDRETRKTPLKEKELGAGMKIINDILEEVVKELNETNKN